jgi:hypothetical protein
MGGGRGRGWGWGNFEPKGQKWSCDYLGIMGGWLIFQGVWGPRIVGSRKNGFG